jgi:hypothetical protein
LAPVIAELERVFRAGNMKAYVAKLAAFKADLAQQQRLARMREDRQWTSETVLELAAVYQLAPFADKYPLAPQDGRCVHCRAEVAGKSAAPVCGVFADRAVHACRKCGGRFVRISGR